MGMIRFSYLLLGGAALLPAPAAAQYIGGNAPAPPPAPVAGMLESPEAALARNVRLLAINPRDYNALLAAGRSALKLGDSEAAIGFFGRAEEINSAHWAPKAGQGAALAQMGEAQAALGLFEQAQRLGATQSLIALDRGLAFDLLARQAEAQSDYRAVLAGPDADEARRRLALSLGISGRKAEALTMLDPLLARRDAGARRARALILALGGDLEGARQAIAAMMPGSSAGFDPFLRRLSTLGPGQKAAAVHLGIMPAEGAALASVEPPAPTPVAPTPAPVVAKITPAPVRVASVTPRISKNRPGEVTPLIDRIADIETTLGRIPKEAASAPKPPPAPKPIIEKTAAKAKGKPAVEPATKDKVRLAELSLKGKTTGKADAKAKGGKAEGKEKKADTEADDKPAKGVTTSSRIYVQLAGGSKADQMEREYSRIRAKKASLFKGRQPVVVAVKGWSRLLVGPFKDQDSAQALVNDLHEAKLEGFVWTAPAGIKVEKLAAK